LLVTKGIKMSGENGNGERLEWIHVFKGMILDGTWAKLSNAAKAVYPVVKACSDFSSGEACPTYTQIMEFSGLKKEAVRNALKELTGLGLVDTEKVGRANRYRVIEKMAVSPTKTATFVYSQKNFGEAREELKSYVTTGKCANPQHVTIIEHADTVNIITNVHVHADPEIIEMLEAGVPWTEIVENRFGNRTGSVIEPIDPETVR